MTKFTVAGTGNGGCAFAADLSLKGFSVTLYDSEQFESNLIAIRNAGGISITGKASEGHAKIDVITTDAKKAVADTDVVLIVAPAFAQEPLFKALAPHIRNGQVVIVISYFGALLAKRWLRELNITKRIILAETQSLLYASRMTKPAHVTVLGVKENMSIAALPSCDTGAVLAQLEGAFPPLLPENNVLQTSFDNLNPIVHSAIFTFNLARIEENIGDWGFYSEGFTQAVARVTKAMETERLEIMLKLKLRAEWYEEIMRRLYRSHDDGSPALKGRTHVEMLRSSPVHAVLKEAPDSINHRYYTEDVPYGLVPFWSFGKLVGVDTPAIKAVITLASFVEKVDYFKRGITVQDLGLENLSASQIIGLVS